MPTEARKVTQMDNKAGALAWCGLQCTGEHTLCLKEAAASQLRLLVPVEEYRCEADVSYFSGPSRNPDF